MGLRGVWVDYGRTAAEALRDQIRAAKGNEPLAPVTVVVPSNQVGVSARRLLASGAVGPVSANGVGLAAVTFLTTYRLAELLGAAALAAAGRRPVSTPVLTAAVRASLTDQAGLFTPVARHPATESALVSSYRELRDLSSAALDRLSRGGERAADVVRLHRAARMRLEKDWYDEEDLMTSAAEALAAQRRTGDDLGAVIVYLPQRVSLHAAALLRAVADRTDVVVLAGASGDTRADAEVVVSLDRLGVAADDEARSASVPVVQLGRTRLFTTSDADEEVRQAIRAVVDAALLGTPLDRVAILHASPEPYDRLVREQLVAAGIAANGATEVPVAARLAGRTLLHLIALPVLEFRRQDMFAWLSAAPMLDHGRLAPVTAWERLSREAGVVGGRQQWDQLLLALAERLQAKADAAEIDADRSQWQLDKWRSDAERARRLRDFVLGLIDALADAGRRSQPWSEWSRWAHTQLVQLLGGADRRGSWPATERRAAERVTLALDRLAALDDMEEAVDLEVFSRTLGIELEADLGREGRFGEGVLVGSVGMGVGLDLDLVILLGLAEGSFPAAIRDDSLLPDHEREAAGGELALRGQRIEREHRQFLVALAGAQQHLLGIPRGDLRRSSKRSPSRWAVEVASTLAGRRWRSSDLYEAEVDWIDHIESFDAGLRRMSFPATEQEHRLRVFLAAGVARSGLRALAADIDSCTAAGLGVIDARRSAAFTRFDGNLAGLTIPSPVEAGTSATSLERWAKCPQAYLVQNLLGAQAVENPEELLQISPLDRGRLVHEVLETFIEQVLQRPTGDQPKPDEPWSPADRQQLRAIAERWCDQYEAAGLTGRPIFWRRDKTQILRDLFRFLDSDDEHRKDNGAHPLAAELAFGMGDGIGPVLFELLDGRSLPLRGKADRVDVTDDKTIHVFDYKTGSTNGFAKLSEANPHERGTKLQLAIYGLAARLHQDRPDATVQADYWFVSAKGDFKQLGYCVSPEVLDSVQAVLSTIVDGIESGVFAANPGPPSTSPWVDCAFCDPDNLGTGELRRQWERKRADVRLVPYADLTEPLDLETEADEDAEVAS